MRRLYLHIYLGILGTLLLLTLVGSLMWAHGRSDFELRPALIEVGRLIGEALPPDAEPTPALQAALDAQSSRLGLDASLWSADGALLARAGRALPTPPAGDGDSAWLRTRRGPPGLAVRLPDGRWLGLAAPRRGRHPGGWFWWLVLPAGLIALGAYPIARRIAARLERLRAGVEALAGGELGARVPVEGRDEVADLARSFNRAAERIEALVGAQRRMLASASHELRSPLARLRLALELAEPSPELRREAERDIAELDELIEDLLLTSQLQARPAPVETAEVDLLALLREEAARVGAEVSGAPIPVRGEPRLLRRLVRNLLENAVRHGGGGPIEARVEAGPDGRGARLQVADRGAGVPESERERIFEPFYRPAGHSEGTHGGVGLGLALVREVARHHGGEARCRPRPGGGTLFEVDLG